MHSSSTNFFLQNINTKEEIHLKGYPVTRLASNADTQFSTEDNFVWGLKVPVSIPHSTEGTDFIKAYPKFAGWVSSGGANNTDWYNTYNTDKVINPN